MFGRIYASEAIPRVAPGITLLRHGDILPADELGPINLFEI